MQTRIMSTQLNQPLVIALLNNVPMIHYNNSVCLFYGRQTMGDYQRCTTNHHRIQRLLNITLGLGIQCGGGFIQHQNGGVFEQRPRYRKPLTLATRQPSAVFTDNGL